MRKVALLIASAAAAATLLPATSASANIGGTCNGVVDASCYYDYYPYGRTFCQLWVDNICVIG
jgi:hypothetical protein